MENKEEQNIQHEIIESLAKKFTGMEKWQAKMDGMELATLPKKVEELHKEIEEIKNMRVPDFESQLNRYGEQLNQVGGKIDAIPKEIAVRQTLQFDNKAKDLIRALVILGIAVAACIAIIVSLLFELGHRAEDKDKYIIVKGFYQDVARQIDSAYVSSPDTLVEMAKRKIQQQEQLLEAEAKAKEAANASKSASQQLKALKNKGGKAKQK